MRRCDRRGVRQVGLRARRHLRRDTELEIAVAIRIGIELWRVRGQREQGDLARMRAHPGADLCGLLHVQVVEDQKHVVRGAANQAAQKPNERRRGQWPVEHHEADQPLVGYGREKADRLPSRHDLEHRRVAARGEAPSAQIARAETRLVAPVDLGALALGARGDRGIVVIKPALNLGRPLFVRPLQGFLRRETPAPEIVTDRAHGHPNPVALVNERADRRARPEGERHPPLIRRLVRHEALDRALLRGRQRALRADAPPAPPRDQRVEPAGFVPLPPAVDGRPMHIEQRADLGKRMVLLAQPNRGAPLLLLGGGGQAASIADGDRRHIRR